MKKIVDEFKCDCERGNYIFKIGRTMASSLSGFLAGIIFTTIAWWIVAHFYLIERACK